MKRILIKRKWAWWGMALKHNITINNYENIKLSCNLQTYFEVDNDDIELDIKSGTTIANFTIKKAQEVKTITLKNTFSDISCVVEYVDGKTVELSNKKSGSNSIILMISICFGILMLFLMMRN